MNSKVLTLKPFRLFQNARFFSNETVTISKSKKASIKSCDKESENKSLKCLDNQIIESEKSKDLCVMYGTPEEHVEERRVRIFKQAKNAMQSATNDTKLWKIEFETRDRWENLLMGWGSSADPLSNMVLNFTEKQEAIDFCERVGWNYSVDNPQVAKKPKIKSYADNFAWNKRTRVGSK